MTADRPARDPAPSDRARHRSLSAIQPFGFLIAVSPDWKLIRVSANIAAHIALTPDEALGRSLGDVFAHDAVHNLRNCLVRLHGDDAVERIFGVPLLADRPKRLFDCALHRAGTTVVIEAEPSGPADPSGAGNLLRAMLMRLDTAPDMAAFLRQGARQMQGLVGFERVMIYRFDAGRGGEIVAEVAQAASDSLLGLRDPASKVPPEARALYTRAPLRIVADVDADPVPIVPARDAWGALLDLSLATLREMSPTHRDYLKALGVAASLSVSILVDGAFWGLFVCHHSTPRHPSPTDRDVAELFGQMFALKLEARERQRDVAFEAEAKRAGDRLLAAIAADIDLLDDPDRLAEAIGAILPCDGVGIWLDGRATRRGQAPPIEVLAEIARHLDTTAAGRVIATDHLAGLMPEFADRAAPTAGLLAIPISRQPRDYALLFRQERQSGFARGDKAHTPDRAAIAARHEEVRGRSAPFGAAEVRIAETVRIALIEVVLHLTESAADDRRRAADRQHLLTAELNHRVRNILAVMRGLVRQSRGPAVQTCDCVELLDGRLEALAGAHDRITEDGWGAVRLRTLFEAETARRPLVAEHALTISGEEVLLEPTAFSAMALVVHELMTNALRHGALAAGGDVLVDWSVAGDGGLIVQWRERGGPRVAPPRHQGFGAMIVERSVPHDLGGSARIDYDPDGVAVRLELPARHVRRVDPAERGGQPAAARARHAAELATPILADCTVLLVEDSLIIAMDAEALLSRLGATHVTTVATVGAAFEELARARPTMAVLDVNLGSETSFPIADRLRECGVPFIFATGYGNQLKIPAEHAGTKILQKPYTLADFADALAGLAD